jgi:hypothetical protein
MKKSCFCTKFSLLIYNLKSILGKSFCLFTLIKSSSQRKKIDFLFFFMYNSLEAKKLKERPNYGTQSSEISILSFWFYKEVLSNFLKRIFPCTIDYK